MNFEQKIFYYKEIKWNIPFRELHHTVVTVCEFVKPIYPNIKPVKYFEYFFSEIEFDKIENNRNKVEMLKYCNAIYYGLEQLLKTDISKEILNYQNNISKLSKEQIQETQIKLIELIGNLKRQARTNEAGISFTKRYNALYKSIEAKEGLFSIDYQILISHFNETILNDLLSSFEIINETFKEITPLLKAITPEPIGNTKETENTPKIFDELFYNTDLVAPSIDILKELDPPLIDTDCNYIGKLKGIICVWIEELQRQGIVKHYSDRKIFASLIPQKIKRFSIDESMFGKYHSKAENNYRTDIKAKVSKIKLSQNSH